jgi:hypothetical protein
MASIPEKFSKTPGKICPTGRTDIDDDTVEFLNSLGLCDSEIKDFLEDAPCDKLDQFCINFGHFYLTAVHCRKEPKALF